MAKTHLNLQKSEGIVVTAAANIYAAYIAAGRVEDGQEATYMERSIRDAIRIAVTTDDAIICDGEMQ
ncbi:MAG: hypothetical protein QGG36_13345 [Pirellulaceae bacterium]|jgi:hypothetical protein|nr:hypothetical protein [Pirellulaceae bacterium]MDP7016781.1 hypothetical protein [Pirellulaceae bacterium]